MGFFAEFILSGVRFFAPLKMTWSEGPGMTPLFCHCEADFVSRSNLVEGQEIATPRQVGAHNDKKRTTMTYEAKALYAED